MTDKVPRDPSEYWPTTHCKQRRKYRGIEWEQVSTAIREGRLHNDGGTETCVFINETSEGLLYVACNHVSGAIATVAWYDE